MALNKQPLGLLQPPHPEQHEGLPCHRLPVAGIQAQDAIVILQRLGMVVLAGGRQPHALQGSGIVRASGEYKPELLDSFGIILLLNIELTQVSAGGQVARIALEVGVVGCLGLIYLPGAGVGFGGELPGYRRGVGRFGQLARISRVTWTCV